MSNQIKSHVVDYKVSIATNKDEEQIITLLKDVANWLKEHQVDQWGFLADGGEDEEIKQAIQNKDTYIVKHQDRIVATFTLYQKQSWWDNHTWGKLDDGAVYLHRLAVERSIIGNGLGKTVLAWAENIIKEMGSNMVRLDCVEHNIKLNNFYRNNGYEKVKTSDNHTLYQKEL